MDSIHTPAILELKTGLVGLEFEGWRSEFQCIAIRALLKFPICCGVNQVYYE